LRSLGRQGYADQSCPDRGGLIRSTGVPTAHASSLSLVYCGPWRTMAVVMFQALEGSGAGIATAVASTLIVVTLLPIVLLYRLVRRYELSML
jgi:iron(III) transport system permease protein